MPRVLFYSDVHGNLDQLKRVVKAAEAADILLIGGDITPRISGFHGPASEFDEKSNFALCQVPFTRNWVDKKFMPVVLQCRCPVYMTFGNTDCASNALYFMSKWNNDHIHILEKGLVPLTFNAQNGSGDSEKWYLFSFPYVNLSNHTVKDYERFDLVEDSEVDKSSCDEFYVKNYIEGLFSNGSVIVKGDVPKVSLESMLDDLPPEASGQRCIWMTHAPPANTNLDMISRGRHVGSFAIFKALQRYQPLFSLHGHIHETVHYTHQFSERIGNTISYCSGNDPWNGSRPWVVWIDTSRPLDGQRVQLE